MLLVYCIYTAVVYCWYTAGILLVCCLYTAGMLLVCHLLCAYVTVLLYGGWGQTPSNDPMGSAHNPSESVGSEVEALRGVQQGEQSYNEASGHSMALQSSGVWDWAPVIQLLMIFEIHSLQGY